MTYWMSIFLLKFIISNMPMDWFREELVYALAKCFQLQKEALKIVLKHINWKFFKIFSEYIYRYWVSHKEMYALTLYYSFLHLLKLYRSFIKTFFSTWEHSSSPHKSISPHVQSAPVFPTLVYVINLFVISEGNT